MLRAKQLTKTFGKLKAVDGCSLAVGDREIVALIGPNGAGKTTFFNLLVGGLRVDGGQAWLFDTNITKWPTERRARLGLVRTFQTPRLFSDLSVIEHLLVAVPGQTGERFLGRWWHPRRVAHEEAGNTTAAWEVLDFLGLADLANDPASTLSGGQKKLLELGRALMTRPKILLLDEPVAGVNPSLAAEISSRIHYLRNEGLTFLIIEHNMDFIMRLADRIYVMAHGQVLREGAPHAVRADPAVLDAYLGAR